MNLVEALQISEIVLTETGYRAEMQLSSFHAQPLGYINGGAILAFAEVTAGQASNLLGNGLFFAVGQSVTGNHLKAGRAENSLHAEAELVHRGKNNHVWNIKISDQAQQLLSLVTVTNALIYQ